MSNQLHLVPLIEDRQSLEVVAFWIKSEEGVNALVHPKNQGVHAVQVLLFKEFKAVEAHELVRIVQAFGLFILKSIQSLSLCRTARSLILLKVDSGFTSRRTHHVQSA